ncbi:MAG: transcriptional regulator [Gammaproteobacteria bacterium]|nr:MAG: transcriptional regulator [Gammaproteobacteria bacterium]
MAQTKQLIDTLKRSLKAHGLLYADVAKHLDLSEASVKRLFSADALSLSRLDKICQLMEMEISDLIMQMSKETSFLVSELSLQQEQEIADDVGLLLITVCILNGWTVAKLMEVFHFNEHQCIRYLAVLDRLKLIDLLIGNRVKLKVSPNFKWRDNGPIQRFFQEKLAADFFNTQFMGEHEQLVVINGMLSDEAMTVFNRKLKQLAVEFNGLNNEEARLPLEQRRGITVVLAMRNWKYGLFDSLRRE